jgi:hypothetical protein
MGKQGKGRYYANSFPGAGREVNVKLEREII